MRKTPYNQEIKRYIFYSEDAYVLHIGEHYEELILQAMNELIEVITVKNINECHSSIPLERAVSLLEKYYKLTNKLPKDTRQQKKDTTEKITQEPDYEKVKNKTKPLKSELADTYE